MTFSGGDPLHENNREEIGRLVHLVKRLYPAKDIWLYTGYTMKWDEETDSFIFSDDEVSLAPFSVDWLPLIDVIVDGRFDAEQRKCDLMYQNDITFRGSSNQRYIDIPNSLLQKEVVEWHI